MLFWDVYTELVFFFRSGKSVVRAPKRRESQTFSFPYTVCAYKIEGFSNSKKNPYVMYLRIHFSTVI